MTSTEAPGATSVRAYSDVEYVFEPHAAQVPALRPYLRDLWDRRRFIVEMARADIRGKRTSTVAGQLWALLDPIFQAAIYFFLLTVLRGSQRGTAPYLAPLIFCVFMFSTTASALNEGGKSIVAGKNLMLNSTFPRAMLPLTTIYKGLLNLVPSLGIYLVIHLVLRRPLGPGLTMLPLLIGIQTVLNIGLALLISTLTVFVRDVGNALTYVSRILLFTTPVIFGVETLSPGLQRVLSWNPLFDLFSAYRVIIAGGVPSGGMVFRAAFFALVIFLLGARTFLTHERAFALKL
jgi:teichoic acid transport system permease protein